MVTHHAPRWRYSPPNLRGRFALCAAGLKLSKASATHPVGGALFLCCFTRPKAGNIDFHLYKKIFVNLLTKYLYTHILLVDRPTVYK